MTIRALIIGILLAAFIGLATYFNDWVIYQTHLVGNHLPIGVFGIVMLLLLVGNPILGVLRGRWRLRPAELAVIAALGLVVCGWAGSNFFRTFITNMAMPANDYPNRTNWQSRQVFSYVPGGSPDVAAGHVTDWPALLERLSGPRRQDPNAPAGRIWARLADEGRDLTVQLSGDTERDPADKRRFLEHLNEAVIQPTARQGDPPAVAWTADAEAIGADGRAWLAEREDALAAAEAAAERGRKAAAEKAELMAEVGQAYADAKAREAALRQEALAVQDALAEAAPRDADRIRALRKRGAAIATRQEQAREAVLAIEDRIAALDRRISRAGWQETYYRNHAAFLVRRVNRVVLVSWLPDLLLPAPRGSGAYLNNAQPDPYATDVLVQGWDGERPLNVRDLPWWVWWPTLRTWGTVAILMGMSFLFIALIVHPQWSKRELLSYPIVRFIDEVTAPAEGEGTGGLPGVMRSRLFWVAMLIVLGIHLWNGLNVWFPGALMKFPLNFSFWGAAKLFPDIPKVPSTYVLFAPTIFPVAVGFGYFLNKEISLSVGVSVLLWGIFGSVLIGSGVSIQNNWFEPDLSPMLRFGAYAGMSLMILYIGRSYYLNVAASAVGFRRKESTPPYATWAFRGLILSLAGALVALRIWAGLDWVLGVMFVLCLIIMSVGMSRVNVETGVFFLQPHWLPIGAVTAVFGLSGLGPEGVAALSLASVVMMQDPRESMMPFLCNALNLSDRLAGAPPRRTFWPISAVLIGGFFVALTATMYWQYTNGCSVRDNWARQTSQKSMDHLAKTVSELDSLGELTASNRVEGVERFAAANPNTDALLWMGVGAALVVLCAVARLRLSWWPLHPVVFLLWGNWASCQLAFSFLLAWLIKSAVMKYGGAKGYRAAMPFMVGLIGGELLAAIGWAIVGAIYYATTGVTPDQYVVLPR